MLILVWLKNLKKGCNVDFFFFFVIIRLVVFQGILLRKIQVKLEIGKSKLITSQFLASLLHFLVADNKELV